MGGHVSTQTSILSQTTSIQLQYSGENMTDHGCLFYYSHVTQMSNAQLSPTTHIRLSS